MKANVQKQQKYVLKISFEYSHRNYLYCFVMYNTCINWLHFKAGKSVLISTIHCIVCINLYSKVTHYVRSSDEKM